MNIHSSVIMQIPNYIFSPLPYVQGCEWLATSWNGTIEKTSRINLILEPSDCTLNLKERVICLALGLFLISPIINALMISIILKFEEHGVLKAKNQALMQVIPTELLINIFQKCGNKNNGLVSKEFNRLKEDADWMLFCELLKEDSYESLVELLIPKRYRKKFNDFLLGKSKEINSEEIRTELWPVFNESLVQRSTSIEINKENLRTIFDGLLLNNCKSYVAFYNALIEQNLQNITQLALSLSTDERQIHAKQIVEIKRWITNHLTSLQNIKKLDIPYFWVPFLPAEIGAFIALRELSLNIGALTSLPPEIGDLTALCKLTISGHISFLPPEIGKLANLTHLDLQKNKLTSLPVEIGKLRALTFLGLDWNLLTSLPPEIGDLTDLAYFDLNDNQLTSVPPEIGNLTALENLLIRRNWLTSIPAEIGKLTALKSLSLDDNQLTSIPVEIGNLSALKSLWLNDNQLTSVPTEILKLAKTTNLYIYNNSLTFAPEKIRELKFVNARVPESVIN